MVDVGGCRGGVDAMRGDGVEGTGMEGGVCVCVGGGGGLAGARYCCMETSYSIVGHHACGE